MAPLDLSLLLLRVDYIVGDIGTVKNRILARHFLNGEKKGGITVEGSHIAKAVKIARYTIVFKTPAIGKRMLAVLLCVCLLAGCAAFSGCGEEPSPYNWEVSIVDSFDPEQCCLKELPWLITMDEAKEILHLADLPADAYEVGKYNGLTIALKNVKLKEFQLPMELILMFRENPGMTGKKGILLIGYGFNVSEIDGYSLLEEDSLPIRMLPEETQEKFEQTQGADLQACMTALMQRPDVVSAQTFAPSSDGSFHGNAFPVIPDQKTPATVVLTFQKPTLVFMLTT